MNRLFFRFLRTGACILAAGLMMPAFADLHITLDRRGSGELPVQYRDAEHLRIGDEQSGTRYLTSGGRNYVLMASPNGDKQFAMDMDEFLERENTPAAREPDLDRLTARPADREETIGGVTGQVYRVESGNDSWELVLTGDDTIRTLTEAVYNAEIRMARMSGQAMAAEPLAAELALARELGAQGILRGRLYTVAALEEGESLPDEHFRLGDDILVVRDWKEMQASYH
ncbi:MAG: hypothetical protein ACOCVV_05275 [Marinobacter sp.]